MSEVRFMTLDPGHFHAALVQKEMYPGVARRVDVYAPLGQDLFDHLKRIEAFNARAERPTAWEVEIHTGPTFFERMTREKPGNAVVISGKNRGKIDRIKASVEAGLHVLADKPWIIRSADMPALEAALGAAEVRGRVAYDVMTERFEITSILQRELVDDVAVFGKAQTGSDSEPGVYMESVHHLMKTVSGVPNIRPAWFFDTEQQGEGLSDIGTHLVDLAQWTLFPGEPIDYGADIRVLSAQRWPTTIPRASFQKVTGLPDFPGSLAPAVKGDSLDYFCNTLVSYRIRGIHVKLNVIWDWEAPAGAGDTHFASYRGTRARIEVRQGKAERYRPELYVVPLAAREKARIMTALKARLDALQPRFPGLMIEDLGPEIRLVLPDRYRVGHEAHFAEVTLNFLQFLKDRSLLPEWERLNMLAKYFVTTTGTELARQSPPKAAPRLAP
jgi:predicted dehydrogenase